MALERMIVDAGKHFPDLIPILEKKLQDESHSRECRDTFNRLRKVLRDMGIKRIFQNLVDFLN